MRAAWVRRRLEKRVWRDQLTGDSAGRSSYSCRIPIVVDSRQVASPEQGDAELAAALEVSWNVTARIPDGRLVGLARVLDDGVLYASVWDLIVLPERQRGGIGRALLAAVLEQMAGRRLVSLVSTAAGEALYRSAGFAETDGRSTALFRRAHEPEQPASDGSG